MDFGFLPGAELTNTEIVALRLRGYRVDSQIGTVATRLYVHIIVDEATNNMEAWPWRRMDGTIVWSTKNAASNRGITREEAVNELMRRL